MSAAASAPAGAVGTGDAQVEPEWRYGDKNRREDYGRRLANAMAAADGLEKRFNKLALARLGVVLGGVLLAVAAAAVGAWSVLAVLAVAAVIFWRLTIVHEQVSRQQRRAAAIAEVNARELRCMQGDFAGLADGAGSADGQHAYADDLDLFGPRGIFAQINRAGTALGRQRLADWLLAAGAPDAVIRRQAAVRELSERIDFLQELGSETLALNHTDEDPARLRDWLGTHDLDSVRLPPRALLLAGSAVLLALIGAVLAGILPPLVPVALISIGWFATMSGRRLAAQATAETRGLTAILERYGNALAVLEQAEFQSPVLRELHHSLGQSADSASAVIPELQAILDCLEVRNNPVMHFPLDAIGFWDLHCLHRLKVWRQQSAAAAPGWLDTLATFEALASLATLAANRPGWAFPELLADDADCLLEASELGHPLIPDAVCRRNELKLRPGQILLITGSNMAGKSTFMRAAGVALSLAWAGGPVCAARCRCRRLIPWTSMRTRDSLIDSESTFYAELRRLKQVIDEVQRAPEGNLFILDEVLRGTNSRDRHRGAEALLRQLIAAHGSGMIATHDLELASLADAFPDAVQLVCFESRLEDGRLIFDYTMRSGVCQNLNASYLMAHMGIQISES